VSEHTDEWASELVSERAWASQSVSQSVGDVLFSFGANLSWYFAVRLLPRKMKSSCGAYTLNDETSHTKDTTTIRIQVW